MPFRFTANGDLIQDEEQRPSSFSFDKQGNLLDAGETSPAPDNGLLGYAPSAIRIGGAFIPYAGFPVEAAAQTAEKFLGTREQYEPLPMVSQQALSMILPGPSRTLAGALAKGAGLGLASTAIPKAIEKRELPSGEEALWSAGIGALLGGGIDGLDRFLNQRKAREALSGSLSAMAGQPIGNATDDIARALRDTHINVGGGDLVLREADPQAVNKGMELAQRRVNESQLLENVGKTWSTESPTLPDIPTLGEPGADALLTLQGLRTQAEQLQATQRADEAARVRLDTRAANEQRTGSLLETAQRSVLPQVKPESETSLTLRAAFDTLRGQRGAVDVNNPFFREPQIDPAKAGTLRAMYGQQRQQAITRKQGFAPLQPERIAQQTDELTKLGMAGLQQQPEALTVHGQRMDKWLSDSGTPEDLQRLVQYVTQNNLGGMDYASRGVRGWNATTEAAARLGMTPETMLKRKLGSVQTVEETASYGYIVKQSVERLRAAVQSQDPQAIAQELPLTTAIIEQYHGSGAEVARALQIRQQVKVGMISSFDAIRELLGKPHLVPEDYFARLSELVTTNPAGIGRSIREMKAATTTDKWIEAWKSGLVSGFRTQIVNAIGTPTFNLAIRVPEELVLGGVDALRSFITGGKRERFAREALADVAGQWHGLLDAMKVAGATWRTEISPYGGDKYGSGARHAIGAGYEWAQKITPGGDVGRFIRLPFRSLEAVDAFHQTYMRSGATYAYATRKALQEGLTGEKLTARVMSLLDDPGILEAATREGNLRAFRADPGERTKALLHLRRVFGPMAEAVIPFISTPVNITRETIKRTPLAALGLLSPSVRQALKDGGTGAVEEALTRVVMGTSVMALAGYLTSQGKMTGGIPVKTDDRTLFYAEGKKPYSLPYDGQWLSFARLEPVALILGMGADFATAVDEYALEPKDAAQTLMASLVRNLGDKTYLQGVSNFADAYQDPFGTGKKFFEMLVSSAVPNVVGQFGREMDPTIQRTQGMAEAVRVKIPGQPGEEEIPPIRDIWGQPAVRVGSLVERLFSPIERGYDTSNDPPTREVVRLQKLANEAGLPLVPGSPMDHLTVKGVKLDLTRQEYDQYVETSGTLARKLMEAAVNSPGWSQMPDMEQLKLTRRIFEKSRDAARKITLGHLIETRPQSLREAFQKGITIEVP